MGSTRQYILAIVTLFAIVSFTYAEGAPEPLDASGQGALDSAGRGPSAVVNLLLQHQNMPDRFMRDPRSFSNVGVLESIALPGTGSKNINKSNPDRTFLADAIEPMRNSGEAKEVHEPRLVLVSADPQRESTGLLDAPLPNYEPITGKQRLKWFALATGGPMSLFVAGPLSAGWGTMLNRPEEYGPHWEGFGQRYGMRLTGVSTGNAMEAVLGAIWKEDPRYFRSPKRSFGARVKYVIISPFIAPGPDGRFRPAYARYAGNVGNNFLSNTWRVPSESDPGDAALRCLWGTLGKMGGNAFNEFWPDVKARVFGK